jgi:hypothetical protein
MSITRLAVGTHAHLHSLLEMFGPDHFANMKAAQTRAIPSWATIGIAARHLRIASQI